MERTPIRSSLASTFLKIHEGVIIRRNIVTELNSHSLQSTVLQPMLKYYAACLIASGSLYKLLKKESLSIRFVCSSGLFSLTFLYLQIYHEEKVFLSKGLEDSLSGEIIRKGYMSNLPTSWLTEKFVKREKEIQGFKKKFYDTQRDLEKFRAYAEKRKFSIEKLSLS